VPCFGLLIEREKKEIMEGWAIINYCVLTFICLCILPASFGFDSGGEGVSDHTIL
jgi:hypothetical protein